MTADLDEYLNEGRLTTRLRNARQQQCRGFVAAGLHWNGSTAFATTETAVDARSIPIQLGCITKALTAALLVESSVELGISLDSPLTEILDSCPHAEPILHGVTLRHLLNHTHGLDSMELDEVPRTADHYIDVQALSAPGVRIGRHFQPGELYSYGHTGTWWAAAAVERLLGMPYSEALKIRLLEPLGIRPQSLDSAAIGLVCPSTGGSLQLTLEELMRVVKHQVELARAAGTRALMPGTPQPPPGWAVERGGAVGWKHFGQRWFGHNALLASSSTCVRFHVEQSAVVLVTTPTRAAGLILARLFARTLPEFLEMNLPRPLPNAEPERSEIEACIGTYSGSGTRFTVSRTPDGQLRAEIFKRSGNSLGEPVEVGSTLQPCTQSAYLLDTTAAQFGPWIQFLREEHSGYRYLWNGRRILSRRFVGS